MALEGEFSKVVEAIECAECGESLALTVLLSGAGYYIGRFCSKDGPYERASDYFPTRESAEAELTFWLMDNVRPSGRDTDFHG